MHKCARAISLLGENCVGSGMFETKMRESRTHDHDQQESQPSTMYAIDNGARTMHSLSLSLLAISLSRARHLSVSRCRAHHHPTN